MSDGPTSPCWRWHSSAAAGSRRNGKSRTRAFEALLTAVSLKNAAELEKDARLIDERHAEGELSDSSYQELQEVVAQARANDWNGAEQRAYKFRAQFGDRGSYFK